MWRVVVDLDALGRRGQAEHLRHAFQQLRLAGALGQLALQRLARVDLGVLHHGALFAALRHQDLDLAVGLQAQRLGDQVLFGQRVVRAARRAAAACRRRTGRGRRPAPRRPPRPSRAIGKKARLPLLRPPRTKNTCTQVWPAICHAAMTSASCRLAGFTTSLPCTKVRARMRSRTAAACSNSSASAACSISVASSCCTVADLPARNAFAWPTSRP